MVALTCRPFRSSASRLAVAPGIRSPCWAAVPPLRLSSHLRCSCRAPRHRLALAPMNWHGLCSCLRPAFGPHSDHISSLLGTSTEATTSPSCVETLLAIGASVWHPDPGVLFHKSASCCHDCGAGGNPSLLNYNCEHFSVTPSGAARGRLRLPRLVAPRGVRRCRSVLAFRQVSILSGSPFHL